MDRFEEMNTFVRVIEAGSFTKAADQLNIAKSAVSRRIDDLERRLGVRLLNRTTRRLNATETGRSFYENCRRMLADLDVVEQEAQGSDAALKGTLRLACPMSFGLRHLSKALTTFLERHPDVDLELDASDRKIDLVEAGLDLSVRLGSPGHASLMARRFAPMRRKACASPTYLAQMGAPTSLEDLEKDHRGLVYSNIPESYYWRFSHKQTGEERSAKVQARLRTNNSEFILDAALAGFGVVAMPTFMCWEAFAKGELVEVLPDYELPTEAAYAVYPEGRPLSRKARVFIDFLIEHFGDEPYWDAGFV